MAGSNDFTGQNIQDTYQRVLQLSSSGQLADGTGSLVPLLKVTASFAISASHEITFEISSSHAQTASFIPGLTGTNSGDVTLVGTSDYITISGQEITRNQIDLANDVTGILPSANLDTDTAHLSTTQTFTGDKTFSGALTASEGLTVIGNISASGDDYVFGNVTIDNGKTFIGNTTNEADSNDLLTVGGGSGTSIKLYSTHTGTGRDVGLHMSASANGQEYSIGLARSQNAFYIAPTGPTIGPENAVFKLSSTGNITASGDISASGNFIGSRQFDLPEVTGTTQGDIIYYGLPGPDFAEGKLHYLRSNGQWFLADKDAENTSGAVILAFALGSSPTDNGMLLRGMFRYGSDLGSVGDRLYVGDSGVPTNDVSGFGTGDIVRIIGYLLGGTDGELWFNPDNTYVEKA